MKIIKKIKPPNTTKDVGFGCTYSTTVMDVLNSSSMMNHRMKNDSERTRAILLVTKGT
jgi:hypothetical protein